MESAGLRVVEVVTAGGSSARSGGDEGGTAGGSGGDAAAGDALYAVVAVKPDSAVRPARQAGALTPGSAISGEGDPEATANSFLGPALQEMDNIRWGLCGESCARVGGFGGGVGGACVTCILASHVFAALLPGGLFGDARLASAPPPFFHIPERSGRNKQGAAEAPCGGLR